MNSIESRSMIIGKLVVTKNPDYTLYGSEGMAGVISIITKDPKNRPALSVDLMGTSHLESYGNIANASNRTMLMALLV